MSEKDELMKRFLEDLDISTKKEKTSKQGWIKDGEVEVTLPVKAEKTSRPGRPKKDSADSVFLPTVAIDRETVFKRSGNNRNPEDIVIHQENKEEKNNNG